MIIDVVGGKGQNEESRNIMEHINAISDIAEEARANITMQVVDGELHFSDGVNFWVLTN